MKDKINGFDVAELGENERIIRVVPRFPAGIEYEGKANIGDRLAVLGILEDLVEKTRDDLPGGVLVEPDRGLRCLVVGVVGGAQGNAGEVAERWTVEAAGMVDESGFAGEFAIVDRGLDGLGGDDEGPGEPSARLI